MLEFKPRFTFRNKAMKSEENDALLSLETGNESCEDPTASRSQHTGRVPRVFWPTTLLYSILFLSLLYNTYFMLSNTNAGTPRSILSEYGGLHYSLFYNLEKLTLIFT